MPDCQVEGEPIAWEFSGEIWYWKGPAPWYFVTVPEEVCVDLQAAAAVVSYGWGMIPVSVHVGGTQWTTSLWPKDGRYVVPLKAEVRRREGLEDGETVVLRLSLSSVGQEDLGDGTEQVR